MNTTLKSLTSSLRYSNGIKGIYTSGAKLKNCDDAIHYQDEGSKFQNYIEREGENSQLKKARLLYQSRKRGMSENGLLLSTFAKKYLNNFNDVQLQLYDKLINLPSNDWDIFYWATEVKPTPPEFDNEIMNLLKKHIRNEDRQTRIMQPEL